MKKNKTQKISMFCIILLSFICVSSVSMAASDTQDVIITMNQPKMCIPYSEEIRGQLIYKCNPTGTGWELNTTCKTGSIPKLNEAGTNLECEVLDPTIPPSIPFLNPFIAFIIFIIISIILRKSKSDSK